MCFRIECISLRRSWESQVLIVVCVVISVMKSFASWIQSRPCIACSRQWVLWCLDPLSRCRCQLILFSLNQQQNVDSTSVKELKVGKSSNSPSYWIVDSGSYWPNYLLPRRQLVRFSWSRYWVLLWVSLVALMIRSIYSLGTYSLLSWSW